MPEQPHESPSLALETIVSQDLATALYLPLAERLRERGRVEEAIRLCEERRQRPGSGVGDHIVLGRCYLADGRLGNAKSEFEAAVVLDRENVVALKALAGILAHEGDHGRASDLYRAVCRIDPGDLESQTALHQITSGEFPEVRPPDVVVGQGDLAWHPVRLPREEEHLPEIALGLRTIEKFDTLYEAPSAPMPEGSEFVELSTLDLEEAPASAPVAGDPGAPDATRVGPPPAIEAPSKRMPSKGNRSAFEEWIGRLGGKG